ncbi:hypothetical protein AVEN_52322-1 [Araneus ventricosus]|uniref:Retrovirus-related Pol polyprotein from transposon TNT 1-94-like beta-barrel domain-containing protein n=1 Tax=Araneus ventricosus TaxID=182803 RepID=A0A4Y2CS95_ARAVE|nr:hypothetical protein AVEN_52322-1 [Araneus ventricosus]
MAEKDLRSFWIDNGTSRHITNCPEYFVDFKSFHSPCGIKAARKETLAAFGKGNICVKTTVGEKYQEIMLRDPGMWMRSAEICFQCWLHKIEIPTVNLGHRLLSVG